MPSFLRWLTLFLAATSFAPARARRNVAAQGLNLRNFGTIGRQLGSNSVNGAVFALADPRYVVKIVPNLRQARKEANIQRQLGNLRIAPKVHNFQVINGVGGAIVMNRLAARNGETYMNLTTYRNKYGAISQSNYNLIKSQFNAMRRAGVVHGNLHWGNIALILNRNGRVKNVKLIDYGRSSRNLNNDEMNLESMNRARQAARPNKEFARRARRAHQGL